jgi:tRNA-intron endonuclease
MPKKVEVELLENFLIVWDTKQGSELYRLGYYGKPVGISKPKIPEFDVPLVLDIMEGLYLAEKGRIVVAEGSDKKKVSLRQLRQKARRLYDEFEAKYTVYRDFREQGLVVTPGIKFGCDFAVYKQGPGVEHAPFMVSVKRAKSEITATEIVKAGRLATTVRKRFIIAVPDLEQGRIRYLMFRWFKA